MNGSWIVTLVVASAVALYASHVDAANVLALFPLPARSHWFSIKPLINGLSQRGHNITLLITDVEKEIPDTWDVMRVPVLFPDSFEELSIMQLASLTRGIKMYDLLLDGGIDICGKLFQQEAVQKLMNTKQKKFDLLIMEYFQDECLLGFAHKFSVPVISVSCFGGFAYTLDVVGDSYTPSYVPDLVNTYTDHMNFWQRLHNTLVVTYARYVYNYYYCPKIDGIMKKHFKDPTMPSVSDLMANTSLLMVQTHASFAYPRPYLPNVIETGGMHIQQPQELPKVLKKLMDNAKDGVIFFSMGSLVRSTDFSQDQMQAFLSAFSKLKQLVMWKWETDNIPGKPSNVHIGKWFPQSDLLAHKNLKLFISHGGLQSSLEATARGVPLIGIPVAAEQHYNVWRNVNNGFGVKLDLENITAQSVEWAIHEVLNNPVYRENAKLRSRLFWDRPQSAADTAVYWAEYVLRHKGAPHLRSAALDLSWYQYLLLDVAAFVLSGVVAVLLILVVAARKLYSLVTARTTSTQERKGKKTTKKD